MQRQKSSAAPSQIWTLLDQGNREWWRVRQARKAMLVAKGQYFPPPTCPPVRGGGSGQQECTNAEPRNGGCGKFLLELTHGPRLTSLWGCCPSLLSRVSELVDWPWGSQEKQTSPRPWQETCAGEKGAIPKLLSFEIVAFTHGTVFHASQSSPPALDAEGPRCRIYFEMLITGRSDLDAETN